VRTSRTAAAVVLAASGLLAVAACGTDNNSTASPKAQSAGRTTSTTAGASSPAAGGGSGGGSASACATGTISGAGSTFQQNMETQWAKDFAVKCSGAQINYQGIGSGGGIQQFGAATIDFAGSDVTMKATEQTAADAACASKAITLPITAGGVAIIYNLKGVSQPVNLSAKTLGEIFQGKIKKWNDAAIAADNSGITLPSTPITIFYRSDASGTTQVFTGFETAVDGSEWRLGTGKTVTWPAGQGAKGSDGVTAGVAQTDGGITYAEVSFAKSNNLPTAAVKGAGSSFATISADSVSKAIAAGFTVTGTGNDLAGNLDFAKMTDGYPISTVSYGIVCSKYKDAAKGALVKAYLSYAVTGGQAAADSLGFAPLPAELVAKDQASLAAVS
jgi:phosphate transport system substrate-binding protein